MTAFETNPELRWLFWFAHPDDEIGISAWMRFLVRNGNQVRAVWGHSSPIREAESRAAMAALGVVDLSFHALGDGDLCDRMAEALPRFQKEIQDFQPDRVVTLAFEQGHLDHDATHVLVRRAFRGPLLEYPMYHPYGVGLLTVNRFSDPTRAERRELDPLERQIKLAIANSYPSQNIGRTLALYDAYRKIRGWDSLTSREWLRVAATNEFNAPNHPASTAARIKRTKEWRRWQDAICAFEP